MTSPTSQAADEVFYLGQGFMPALERALESREGGKVDLLADLSLDPGKDEDGKIVSDPHVWLDPVRYRAMVEQIGVTLGAEDRAMALANRIDELDAEFRAGLRTCARRQIVTSHAAFGYLAERYGLRAGAARRHLARGGAVRPANRGSRRDSCERPARRRCSSRR